MVVSAKLGGKGTARESVMVSTMDRLPENMSVAFPSPDGSDSSPCSKRSTDSTPRKNKRKMTEPKKRAGEVKRFCPDGVVKERRKPYEYPPDTPETSPSPESMHTHIPEASSCKDLTVPTYHLPMPPVMPVTPPMTPGRARITHQTPIQTQIQHRDHTAIPPSPSPSQVTDMSLPPSLSVTPQKGGGGGGGGGRRQRKNYKNMTRERRVEANARERTRVHTISAAFETLRRAVPSYSYNQRLSKLAILKIACSYIMSLGQLTTQDYTPGTGDNPGFAQCVDRCTQTIQAEGRAKRRH